MFVKTALLIYPSPTHPLVSRAETFAREHQIKLTGIALADFLAAPGLALDLAEHVVVLADDETMADLVSLAKTLNFSLGIIPLENQVRLHEWFMFPTQTNDCLPLAFQLPNKSVDVLRCNNETALGSVMLGDTPFLDQSSKAYRARNQSAWRRLVYTVLLIINSLRNLFTIHPFGITLTVGQNKPVKTAITGMISIENNVNNAAARMLTTSISVQDGKVSSILIAPKSIMDYLAFLLKAVFHKDKTSAKLPKAISYIRSQYLKIDSQKPLTYYLDSQPRSANCIEMELYPEAVKLNLSDEYFAAQGGQRGGKDTLKLENLPHNEERISMIQRRLPLFTNAVEEDFRELFLQLRDNAKSQSSFIALMILSSLVATLGLFLSSPAVIIGAMVLAPLMAPIISLAMGVLRSEQQLIKQSLTTIGIGVTLALLTSALLALIIPISKVTSEISGRLHPNLLDLGVAVFSGVAGAYAHARESIMKSMPGVAIAVALVPPLCVVGIGIGWWEWEVMSGAALLFLTNLVGIALAAAITFLVLGYAPLVKAHRGLVLSLTILAVITVPLTFSFHNMYQVWRVEQVVLDKTLQINGKHLQLDNVQVQFSRADIIIQANVSSEVNVLYQDLVELKQHLEHELKHSVKLKATPRITL